MSELVEQDPDDTPDAPPGDVPGGGGTHDVEMLLRLLLETVRDYAIFVLDPAGHVLTWNPGAQRFKGYTADEIIGRHFSTFYPESDIAAGKPAFELEVAAEVGRFEDEGWRIRRDGSRFWANVVITALRDASGTLVGYAKVTRDLTERRAAELRAIEDARRLAEVETANRTKSEFLAAMSHELRTPLNAIGGYVDLLLYGLRGPLTEQQKDDLTRIRRSQQHLLAIINDLLNFSRIEAGRITYDIEPTHVRPLVDEVASLLEPQAVSAGVHLEWADCADHVALADASKLEQILLNLLSNAIKFTPADGSVTVRCTLEGDRVAISITDTGIGIPLDRQAEIFEPFVQVGRSLSSAHEGAGLGLAISRDLARAMGGDLNVRSQPGAGSTFFLTLNSPSTID